MLARYISTIDYNDLTLGCFADRQALRPGQWVENRKDGIRGQFMGITKGGVVGIRWQDGKFTRHDAKMNAKVRQYVKAYE